MNERAAPRRRKTLRIVLVVLAGVAGLPLFVAPVAVESYEIQGPSMAPTLVNGDRILVSPFGDVAPGVVVVARAPHDGMHIPKRIIGVSGDTIEIRGDVVYRNGEPLPRRSLGPASPGGPECTEEVLEGVRYVTATSPGSPVGNHPAIVVPDGHVYLLGDHRDRSNDSRFFGPIPADAVVGTYLTTYFHGEGPSCPEPAR